MATTNTHSQNASQKSAIRDGGRERTDLQELPAMDIAEKVDEIRERWADCSWPKIGYFVHGQARDDIAMLLGIIDAITDSHRAAEHEIEQQRKEIHWFEENERL